STFYLRTGLGAHGGRAQWAITAAVAANPTSPQAWDLLGQWEWQSGQPDAAITALRAAITHDPRYAPAHAHLALIAWALGAGTTARIEAAEARALSATSAAIWRGTTLVVAPDDSLAI
ncbi:MAG: tetratricopeptide repeat protein, partial [Ktedonobacterales bacterium]|nr:tetratricopeptide repeat protein [Ktedonobacterales bacterium]